MSDDTLNSQLQQAATFMIEVRRAQFESGLDLRGRARLTPDQQYAITSLGRQSLMDRLRSFSEQDARSEDAFRVRVGFFSMLSGEDREKILATREVALRSRNQILSNLTKAMALDAYGSEVVAFLREQSETELAWIGRLRQLDSKTQKSKAD